MQGRRLDSFALARGPAACSFEYYNEYTGRMGGGWYIH